MTTISLSLAIIILYLITWALITLRVRVSIDPTNQTVVPSKSHIHNIAWLFALILHIVLLHLPLMLGKPLALSLFSLGSYVMWFISLVLFITALKRKVDSLAIFILPIVIISLILPLIFDSSTGIFINMKSGLGVHVLMSLLAYSFLMLASFQALLLSAQNNRLHTHQSTGFFRTLPSLEDMEHLLFRFIIIGVILLSIALLTGFYYLENLFGQRVAHKTILSILSWVIFSSLLFGRWKYGWRGKKAVHWTLAGFIVLMVAFFGTKLIQEFILK